MWDYLDKVMLVPPKPIRIGHKSIDWISLDMLNIVMLIDFLYILDVHKHTIMKSRIPLISIFG